MTRKRAISIAVSVGILAVIYWRIDAGAMLGALAGAQPMLLAAALALFVPQVWLMAWRLCRLVPGSPGSPGAVSRRPLGIGEAVRFVLAAASLNMVLPSKMGDLAKAWFIRQRGHMSGAQALSLVVFEKGCDVMALLTWCLLGLALYPNKDALFWTLTAAVGGGLLVGVMLLGVPGLMGLAVRAVARWGPAAAGRRAMELGEAWARMHAWCWTQPQRMAWIALGSIALWFVHLLQIWLFILALRQPVGLVDTLALTPLALLAGLLPLTFAGVGTRDAALIYFFRGHFDAAVGAALGLLCTLRYVVPALAGLVYLGQYQGSAVERLAR